MKNIEYIKYTYWHRKIVIFLADKYVTNEDIREKVINQIKKHDLDKLFLYMLYDKEDASTIHRTYTSHHQNTIPKTNIDYIEMVLDWESARYTKPDKPLNAYDTLYKYYPELEDKILPILKEYGIAEPNLPMEDDVLEYTNESKLNSIDEIRDDLKEYIDEVYSNLSNDKSKTLKKMNI